MQTAINPQKGYARKVAQLVGAMPDELAREVLHYAEYLAGKQPMADARWEALLDATSDEALQKFIDSAMLTETTDIGDAGDVLKPQKLA